jgi:6-phosphogluconolactonase/glucosamine-6-phosphate isomerase/deaminase
MDIEVLTDSESVAQRAASIIADDAWEAIAARGSFVMAVSGGHTPWLMLRDRARKILWVVTGNQKAEMCRRLLSGYRSIPAGRICHDRALVLADCAAARTAQSLFKGEILCA